MKDPEVRKSTMEHTMHRTAALVAATIAMAVVTGCRNPDSTAVPAEADAIEITFKSDPETPKMGENDFEVTVTQDGKPVDDAQVEVELFMPAMPQMNMKEMRTRAALRPMGNGTYRGRGEVMMGGNWDVMVTATKDGREIGSRRVSLTAK